MSSLLRAHRLRFLGHVARREEGRWVKQLLFAHAVPGHGRGVGGQRLTWNKVAERDMQGAPWGEGDWYEACQNRGAWRDAVGAYCVPAMHARALRREQRRGS